MLTPPLRYIDRSSWSVFQTYNPGNLACDNGDWGVIVEPVTDLSKIAFLPLIPFEN